MNATSHSAEQKLLTAIRGELRARPDGVSEYELLQALDRRLPDEALGTAGLRSATGLYRTHFLLFHYLYRLRAEVRREGLELDIHCLRILLKPGSRERVAPAGALATYDPLAEFYLDLNNLEGVDGDQVEALLESFWRRYGALNERDEALAVLELEDPVDVAEIKTQYRRLVMRHHPDRGGDKETLQRINRAMTILLEPS